MKPKRIIKEKIKKVNAIKVEADIKKMNDKDSRSTIIFVGISMILGIIPLKTFSGEPRLILSTIAFMELTPIAIVGCVTGMAKYLYRIK